MQIVIDIPEDTYTYWINEPHERILADAIKNGKPLPKGHGRLIDADALENEISCGIKAGNFEEGYEHYTNINDIGDCVECIKYADTIIEADRGEEER